MENTWEYNLCEMYNSIQRVINKLKDIDVQDDTKEILSNTIDEAITLCKEAQEKLGV